MFPPSSWNKKENTLWCREAYGENPQYNWALDYFGGHDPKKDFMKASNIVFSNGSLDPWHAGGILEQVSPWTTSIYIQDSAHHLDLRLPNKDDTQALTEARQKEAELIAKWIDEYQGTNFMQRISTNKTFLQ